MHQGHVDGMLKYKWPVFSNSVDLSWGLRMYISNKFSGGVFAFVTNARVMMMQLGRSPHLENHTTGFGTVPKIHYILAVIIIKLKRSEPLPINKDHATKISGPS